MTILDLVLTVDSSGSIGQNNWDLLIDFLVDFVGQLGISSGEVRVALVQFGTKSKIKFRLGVINDAHSVQNAIRELVYTECGPSTNMADGIKDTIVAIVSNGRANVNKVVLFITDGKHNVSFVFSTCGPISNVFMCFTLVYLILNKLPLNLSNKKCFLNVYTFY